MSTDDRIQQVDDVYNAHSALYGSIWNQLYRRTFVLE